MGTGPARPALTCDPEPPAPSAPRRHHAATQQRRLHPQPAQHPGARPAGRQLPGNLGGSRTGQRGAAGVRPSVFHPEGRACTVARCDVQDEGAVPEVRSARGHARAGARQGDPVRRPWRVPDGAGPHGGSRRRRTASRVRGTEGAAGSRGTVRPGPQAADAGPRAAPGGNHLAHRCRRARCAERARPPLPVAGSGSAADPGAGRNRCRADHPPAAGRRCQRPLRRDPADPWWWLAGRPVGVQR